MSWNKKEQRNIRMRQIKDAFSHLSENLTGSVSEDHQITGDMIRIWCSHALSVIVGCVAGWGSYAFCAAKQQAYDAAMVAYETGLAANPPVSLLFILTIIMCWIVALILSTVTIAMVQIIGGGLLTANLKNRAEIRILSVSISFLCYVLVLAAGIVIRIPV